MGGTGCTRRGSLLRAQSNCGVLKADNCTIVSRTFDPSWISSLRSESVKPRIAALAPQ